MHDTESLGSRKTFVVSFVAAPGTTPHIFVVNGGKVHANRFSRVHLPNIPTLRDVDYPRDPDDLAKLSSLRATVKNSVAHSLRPFACKNLRNHSKDAGRDTACDSAMIGLARAESSFTGCRRSGHAGCEEQAGVKAPGNVKHASGCVV